MQIILLIVDGFGVEFLGWMLQYQEVRDIFARFESSAYILNTPPTKRKLPDDKLHDSGMEPISESATAASTIATGKWAPRYTISTDKKGKGRETLAEYAHKHHRRCGAITSTFLADATPAAFFAHNKDRTDYADIQRQLDESKCLRVAVGCVCPDVGPSGKYTKTLEPGSSRVYPYTNNFPIHRRSVSVQEALLFVWQELKRDRFILVEEGLVDVYAHEKNIDGVAHELRNVIDTMLTCFDLVSKNPDTLFIMTADHATGAARIINNRDSTKAHIELTHNDHNSFIVPLFACGLGSDAFRGTMTQVDVHRILKQYCT